MGKGFLFKYNYYGLSFPKLMYLSIKYNGLFFTSSYILPIYNARTPIVNIIMPLKKQIARMRLVYPETKIPPIKYLYSTPKAIRKLMADIRAPSLIVNFNGLSE